MFSWFANLFSDQSSDGVFVPPKRVTYRYWNGQRMVRGDPLALLRALAASDEFNFDVDAKLAAADGELAIKASQRIVAGVRKAFGIQPVDAGGLEDRDCDALLIHFMEWNDSQKKSGEFSRTSAKPARGSPAGHSLPANGTPCTSAAAASMPDAPPSSPTESASL